MKYAPYLELCMMKLFSSYSSFTCSLMIGTGSAIYGNLRKCTEIYPLRLLLTMLAVNRFLIDMIDYFPLQNALLRLQRMYRLD